MSAPIARNTQRVLMLTAALMLAALGGLTGARPSLAAPASSAKTIKASAYDPEIANAPFPDLAVTVSQTTDLVKQGLRVSWTGAKQSTVPSSQTAGQNFLQVMQCWGDEPGSNGTRPDRTTCQYGAYNIPGDSRWSYRATGTVVPTQDAGYTIPSPGFYAPTVTAIPFRSATGKTLASVIDGKAVPGAPDLNSNEFFTRYTTNEISWAGSGADGSGSVEFELQTAQESPGLGCAASVTSSTGSVTGASCWLVVIPRGDTDPLGSSVKDSGLFWDTWQHHVAVRLGFKPAGLRCAIGSAERQLSGSELVLGAVGQWQPTLCSQSGGAVYSLLTGPESDAALAANGTDAAPLALTSRALSMSGVKDSLTYAPIALAGVSVAFAIDRQTRVDGAPVPAEITARERQAFTTLKLTPRLLVKLLTSSYIDALPSGADISYIKTQVRNVTQDPDFLAINDPEWAYMRLIGPGVGDAMTPLGRSDTASTVWKYIMADPAANAFLNGEADNVRPGDKRNAGMTVNKYYSVNASVNPTGTGLSLPTDNFPKADPVEFRGYASHNYADSVNLVTWRPYTSSLEVGGYLVLRGDSQLLGDWDALGFPPKYGKAPRALVGLQAVIGLTDTAAAARYQVVQAALLNPAGKYVTPNAEGLAAAASAMTSDPNQKQVLGLDPTSAAAKAAGGAYPLAMPVYAAVNPAMKDPALRTDYANFITYAASNGQVVGTGDGQLPDGYAPIPAAWKTQALSAAAVIKSGATASATPTASASSSSPAPATDAPTTATPPTAAAVQQPAAQAQATTAVTNPNAAGAIAPSLTAGKTGDDPGVGPMAAAVPVSAAAALAAALAIPALTRRRRL